MAIIRWTEDKIKFLLDNYSYQNRIKFTERFRKRYGYISVNGIVQAGKRFANHAEDGK